MRISFKIVRRLAQDRRLMPFGSARSLSAAPAPTLRGWATRLWLGLPLAVALAGCAGRLAMPTEADAVRAAAHWPGTTVNELTRGRALYVSRCASCHSLYQPREFPPQKWGSFVGEMAERAKLSPLEVNQLVHYLMTAAEAPPPPAP
jgi:mono/diheme cytochrome c family protein